MQATYECYRVTLRVNQRDIRVPMGDGGPWRLLFTYHLRYSAFCAIQMTHYSWKIVPALAVIATSQTARGR